MNCGSSAHESIILVVDDESAVRRFVRMILESAGQIVLEASSGEEALRLLEEHDPRPDLLLTDIVMPGMSGIALAAQAHKRFPGLHVLFMSGYSQDFAAELSGSVCVVKPFKPAELVAAIQSALARA
ncbi:MAG TPA: response regulator [Bryobacteraceae bacterium]